MRLSLTIMMAACALCFAVPAQAAFEGCATAPTSPLVANVKDKGAKGDGKANDTAPIQKAIDEVAGTGGTVYVPNGVCMVRATGRHLVLGSRMTLKLADRAVIKVIPTHALRLGRRGCPLGLSIIEAERLLVTNWVLCRDQEVELADGAHYYKT